MRGPERELAVLSDGNTKRIAGGQGESLELFKRTRFDGTAASSREALPEALQFFAQRIPHRLQARVVVAAGGIDHRLMEP